MSFYKYISSEDRVVSSTNLTEQITTISSSGTDAVTARPAFTKRSYFLEYYSGSANHLFDVTVGRTNVFASASAFSGSAYQTANLRTDLSRSVSNYNQMAKLLLGTKESGDIEKFSRDIDNNPDNNEMATAFFVNFNRSYFKDKIKPGTFSMEVAVSGAAAGALRTIVLSDISGNTGPSKRLCQTGEYGALYAIKATGSTQIDTNSIPTTFPYIQGLIFYEAGVAVVSPSIFAKYVEANANPYGNVNHLSGSAIGILTGVADAYLSGTAVGNIADLFQSKSLGDVAETFATRILTASYQATTELNSTIYFCRAFNSEFNYSSNPTYLSASEIRVKGGDPLAQPVSYITSVGLYDDKNQLLAVAKLSEPIKKTPETELIARVRLDF